MPTRYGGGERWISSPPSPPGPTKSDVSPDVGRWWFLALYETPLLFSGLLDGEGRVLDGNQVSIEGCGLIRDEIIGRPFWEGGWWSPDPILAEQIRVWCGQVLASGDSLRATTPYFLGDGTVRMVDLALHPLFDHDDAAGGDAYIVATGLDVTDALVARAEREEHLAVEADALRLDAEARLRQLHVVQASEELVRDRLSRLASAAIDMVGAESLAELTEVVFDQAFPIIGADGGALIVRRDDELRVFLSDRLGASTRARYEQAPFDSPWPGRYVARTGNRLVLANRTAGIAFLPDMAQVYEDTGRLAWVYVPLTVRGQLLGSMAVSWKEEREVSDDELALIEAIAAQCAQVIERIQVSLENEESARHIENMVESIQRSLLTASPTWESLDIGTQYLPAAQSVQVGGDWYDAFTTTNGSTLLVVGDVAGHDGDAAAAMAQLRNMFRGLAINGDDSPATLLDLLDRAIESLDLKTVATVLVARIDDEQDDRLRVRWANAGHLPPLVRHADGEVEILWAPSDLLLGVDAAVERSEHLDRAAPFLRHPLVHRRARRAAEPAPRRRPRAVGGRRGRRPGRAIDGALHRDRRRHAPGCAGGRCRGHGGPDERSRLICMGATRARGRSRRFSPGCFGHKGGCGVSRASSGRGRRAVRPDAVMGQERRVGIDLTGDERNVQVARSFIAGVLDLWNCDDPDRIVELLTSEIVTNAVRHAGGPVRVEAALDDDGVVKVETVDRGPDIPILQTPDASDHGGRGLILVQSLARQWGVDSYLDHKVVWFEVPLAPRPSAAT